MTLDGLLYIAPIPDPIPQGYRVLDIGTGTGMWAIEFAEEHPTCQMTGVDLSPVQPQYVPDNCEFIVDDIEYEWTYERPFDYIHGRFLSMGIRDWSRVFQQSYQHLKPGGWVEYQEAELTFPTDPTTVKDNPEMRSLSDDVKMLRSELVSTSGRLIAGNKVLKTQVSSIIRWFRCGGRLVLGVKIGKSRRSAR